MKFELLSAVGKDAERWHDLVAQLPSDAQDIHFLPEYGRIYHKTYGDEPFLAVATEGSATLLQPFVRRPLSTLRFLEGGDDSNTAFDLANAYGYGGPIAFGESNEVHRLAHSFGAAFHDCLLNSKVVSEFCSLHPFLLSWQRLLAEQAGAQPVFQKNVVYVDIAKGEDAIHSSLGRGARSKIKKARAEGVTISRVEPDASNLSQFNALYRRTMDRNLAAARWYFPDDYFANCVAELGPQRTSLFFAQVGDQLASAYFLMHAFGTAYYHFGASNEDYFQYRPNDLLMLETALWAHRAGYRRYHLGGGVTSSPDDALFRFKSSFGKCTAPLYTYFRIHNHESYEQLASLKRQHEIAVHGCESVSNFVPAYRRPFVADGIS